MHKKSKVIAKQSNVTGIGNGLFAIVPIKKGNIIAEFKGKLRSSASECTNSRSNIYFNDEYVLECYPDDLASFANDAINFPKERRFLMKSLNSNEPFYKKHDGTKINAEIKVNDNLHRAFLSATEDIAVGEEIFTHYGFMYWFKTEIIKLGFLQEEEIDQNGFPDYIFEYPAFLSYLKEFYPNAIKHEVKPYKGNYDLILHFEKSHIVMPFEKFSDRVKKIQIGQL